MQRVLTGITTTGTPHLGNYVGAIRPALALSDQPDTEAFYFLADYHALVKCQEPERVQRSTLEIAASWLALGLDPERVHFYRQSDIPEIPELTWLLSCVAAKGLLNRAHAYKAAAEENQRQQLDPDAGISMGLFNYPVLMAADILMFKAHRVPVGRDQVQHIEIARDIAQRFNHLFGHEHFVLPQAQVDEQVAVLPGLDGRKMSKSYDNTIPLWLPEAGLRKLINKVITNSLLPGQPKDPDSAHLFTLYQAFASTEQSADMRQALLDGLAWGEAKQAFFELVNSSLGAARERYHQLVSQPDQVEQALQHGADKARRLTRPFMAQLRAAVGLRRLVAPASTTPPARDAAPVRHKGRGARLVEFRGKDGLYYFKLLAADGQVLLTSLGHADAGSAAQAKGGLAAAERQIGPDGELSLLRDGQLLAMGTTTAAALDAALLLLADAD